MGGVLGFGGGAAAAPMAAGQTAAAPQGGGLFSNLTPQMKMELTQSLLQGAQQASGGASPILRALTPIISTLASAKVGSQYEAARTTANKQALDSIMSARGGALSPDQLAALGSIGGDNMVSDPVRSLATSLMKSGFMSGGMAGGGGRAAGGGGGRRRGGGATNPATNPTGRIGAASAAMVGQVQHASESLRKGIEDLTLQGFSEEEAAAQLRQSPYYQSEWAIVDSYAPQVQPQGPVIAADTMAAPGLSAPPAAAAAISDPLGIR